MFVKVVFRDISLNVSDVIIIKIIICSYDVYYGNWY